MKFIKKHFVQKVNASEFIYKRGKFKKTASEVLLNKFTPALRSIWLEVGDFITMFTYDKYC